MSIYLSMEQPLGYGVYVCIRHYYPTRAGSYHTINKSLLIVEIFIDMIILYNFCYSLLDSA